MKDYKSEILNLIILGVIAICFGSTFLFISLSLYDFSPLSSGSGRIILAGMVSTIFIYMTGNKFPNTFKLWFYSGIYGVFCLALPFTLIPFALKTLPSGEVAIYLSSIPLFVLLLARLILKEQISIKRWIGFFVGFSGLIFLFSNRNLTANYFSNELFAALICIIASVLLAAGGIIIQKMPKFSPISLTGASLLLASIVVMPIFLTNLPKVNPDPISLFCLVAVGIFSTFLGNTMRFVLIKRTSAVFTSINGFIAPIIASLLGIVILGEQVTIGIISSYLIIVVGICIAQDMDKNIYNWINIRKTY